MSAVVEEVVSPDARAADLARASSRQLQPLAGQDVRVSVNGQDVVIPAAAMAGLVRILTEMAEGNAITLIPIHAELTTQQAADLLNVSRPYLIRLLESGRLPFTLVGTHRRIRFADLKTFKQRSDQEREKALAELAADAQEQGHGY